MKPNSFTKGKADERDILTPLGHNMAVDDWIYRKVPCVLLYKDGIMDIHAVQDYATYELAMLRKDSSYKSPWLPIGYGSFKKMQKLMYEIASERLAVIGTRSRDME